MEEKKRGQRLFGGLVSTLNRTVSGTQQQKRLEIERRQHEKAQQRRAEDEKRRAERLEQLKRTRQIEQVKLDERAVCHGRLCRFPFAVTRKLTLLQMKTRHSAMLAQAHSLRTRSEPKLVSMDPARRHCGEVNLFPQYYLPWERTKEQEDIISDQIRTAEETIDGERRAFKTRKEQRLRELGVSPPPGSPSPPPRPQRKQPAGGPETESQSENATVGDPKRPPQDTNPDVAAAAPSKAPTDHTDKDHDENGDEMMQDEEDMVIY